jgi:hypothetical protein
MIFDRAGYSPEFAEQWKQRIAVITYHKFPAGQWRRGVWSRKVHLVSGEEISWPWRRELN